MSVLLPSRRPLLGAAWCRNELWRRARAVPSLDLRFADNKSLVDATTGQNLVTFTRASSGTYVDSQGVIRTATTNEARFDHDPTTGESLGLLVEEQRTNSIRNNTMVGAVAGTPGTLPTNWVVGNAAGMTTNVAAIASENGINYIDLQITGSPTSLQYVLLYDNVTQSIAANGQAWSSTFYVKIVGGSQTNISSYASRIRFGSAAGGFTEIFDSAIQPSASTIEFARCRTGGTSVAANASTERVISGIVVNLTATGVATSVTLRIGLPQLEQGAFATSVIPTTTATVTRSADVASISGSNFSSWYRQDEGTVFASSLSYGATNSNRRIAFATDGTTSNRFGFLYNSSNAPQLVVASAGVVTANPSVALTGANYAIAAAYKLDDYRISAAGSNVSADTSGALPVGISQLSIGSQINSEPINGTIRRLTYWPARLPNSTLQAITQ